MGHNNYSEDDCQIFSYHLKELLKITIEVKKSNSSGSESIRKLDIQGKVVVT